MTIHVVTVFGGTGFLGRSIVQHLRKREFCVRIASRHPERSQRLFGIDPMFGSGMTRLQPAYVEDVAEAIVRALQQADYVIFECGGPPSLYLRGAP